VGRRSTQTAAFLNFKIWTGKEVIYRKIYARVVRSEQGRVAFKFAENDTVSQAFIQDLLFYQKRERRRTVRNPLIGTRTWANRS
jgi:hypothetical protein